MNLQDLDLQCPPLCHLSLFLIPYIPLLLSLCPPALSQRSVNILPGPNSIEVIFTPRPPTTKQIHRVPPSVHTLLNSWLPKHHIFSFNAKQMALKINSYLSSPPLLSLSLSFPAASLDPLHHSLETYWLQMMPTPSYVCLSSTFDHSAMSVWVYFERTA